VDNLDKIRTVIRNIISESFIDEKFNVIQNTMEITEPYDSIQKIKIGDKDVYVLFGDIDYYSNKQSILAIKRKPSELNLNHESYYNFLKEFKKRFYSIERLKNSDLIVSVETTCPVTSEMAKLIDTPFVKDGFKKTIPFFKMKDVDLPNRAAITNLFNLNFQIDKYRRICIIDDFMTTGTTFKNAFNKLPENIDSFGVCLFRLRS
jgi:adenine/guanine phosphoribosyltransferase-like PRPP-binding protein